MYKNVHEPVYLTNPQARSRSSTWTLPYARKNAIIYEALIPCTVNAFQPKAENMKRGHGSVPLRLVGNVVVRMRTQQHHELICDAKISTLLSVFIYIKICIMMR